MYSILYKYRDSMGHPHYSRCLQVDRWEHQRVLEEMLTGKFLADGMPVEIVSNRLFETGRYYE